jgi:hypothetical protein
MEARLEAGRGRGELGHPDRRDALDLDVVGGHGALPLDDLESRLDLGQPRRVGGQLGLQFGLAQPQHAAQLLGADLLVQHRPDLVQAEAEILQRDDAVEPGQLAGRVEAVAAGRVDPRRAEQPGRVVVPQHPHRDPAVPGEFPNGEHDVPKLTASHRVRVKRLAYRSYIRLLSTGTVR